MSYDGRTPSVALTGQGQILMGDASGRAATLAAGATGELLRVDESGVAGWGGLNYARVTLPTDVVMTSANTFYDGPGHTGLASRRYLYVGAVVVQLDGGADHITARLWDGTTVVADAEDTGASGDVLTLVLIGSSLASLKVSVAGTVGGHTIKAVCPHNATVANASYLHFVELGHS